MRIGEVSLLTNDVVRLADFYKKLLDIHNGSDDPVHQTLIGEETMLTIYDDGSEKNNQNQNSNQNQSNNQNQNQNQNNNQNKR